MSRCPTCGKDLDASMRFCPDDGTPLAETASGQAPTLPQTHTPAQPGAGTKKLTLELPAEVGGRYRLLEVRGGGGMARVYRAVDLTLQREVAVKLINPELRQEAEFDARFQREARIASQLNDPHIVVVHDFGLDPAHGPYLVMEYLRGQSLRERLQTQGVLPLKAALQLGAQMLLALIHAHEKGIVHRDIKPDNVFLLNQSGVRLHVRVLDFGIARIYRDDDPGKPEPLTQPGAVMGTPRYMSPEQLAGQPIDARSDLYSAALVIHESLTGQLPYTTGKKLTELCLEATPALQELIEHCLKPDSNMRPASAVEVYLRLQELGKASGILLLPPGAMERLLAARQPQGLAQAETIAYEPGQRRRWKKWALLAVVAAAVLGLAAWGAVALISKLASSGKSKDRETLLDIQIGDSAEVAAKKLKWVQLAGTFSGKPVEKGMPYLGHVLKPEEDIGKDVNSLWIQSSPDGLAVLVLDGGAVRAVVVRTPYSGSTGRGLKIKDTEERLKELYPEKPTSEEEVPPRSGRGSPVKVLRYDDLGIGFEVHEGKVTGITLYPVQSP